jgi:hypothetical protein
MRYLNKYKVGTPLFRTLSEMRMQASVLRHAIQFNSPPPERIISATQYLEQNKTEGCYLKIADPATFELLPTRTHPESAQPLLDKRPAIAFPESFVMTLQNGRVYGEGTTITPQNAVLADTAIDFHRHTKHHQLLHEKHICSPERFDGRLAVISSPGSSNYFHWTLDSLPRFNLLARAEKTIDAYYVHNNCRFQQEWLQKLGITSDKIISASPNRHIEARELIVPSFAGLPGLPSPESLEFLRGFRPENLRGKGARIYISRSDSKRRRILNEQHLLPILKKHGFTIVHPGRISVEEQMAVFAEAEIIVAPHGAELTNLVYCQPGTHIVEILSPYYLNRCFRELAGLAGLQHTALIGRGGSNVLKKGLDTHYVWANIRVAVADFAQQLEMALR